MSSLDGKMAGAQAAGATVRLRVHAAARWRDAAAVMAAAERQKLGKFSVVDGPSIQTSCP